MGTKGSAIGGAHRKGNAVYRIPFHPLDPKVRRSTAPPLYVTGEKNFWTPVAIPKWAAVAFAKRARNLDRHMPLTAEQEKALKPLLLKGTLATDASLEPFLAAVEPDLLAALGTDHPLAGDSLQLRRFLVARKLKVPATVEMISAHVKWRAENLPIKPEGAVLAELQKGKFYSYGTDAAGRPLVLIHSGKFDPATRDLEASVRSVFYEIERVIAQLPPGQAQFAVFYDRTGFSIKKNWDYTLLKAGRRPVHASDSQP